MAARRARDDSDCISVELVRAQVEDLECGRGAARKRGPEHDGLWQAKLACISA